PGHAAPQPRPAGGEVGHRVGDGNRHRSAGGRTTDQPFARDELVPASSHAVEMGPVFRAGRGRKGGRPGSRAAGGRVGGGGRRGGGGGGRGGGGGGSGGRCDQRGGAGGAAGAGSGPASGVKIRAGPVAGRGGGG